MTKAYAFAGSTMTVLVPGEQTNGLFAVLHVTKPSGSSTPPHSHDAETELSYVLSGSLGVETEGRTIAAGPGQFVLLPATRPHRLFNNSDAAVREFLLCTPAKFDRFVATAGTPVAAYAEPSSMTDDDRRRLVAAAPEFGIRLLASAAPQDAAQDTANFACRNTGRIWHACRVAGGVGRKRQPCCPPSCIFVARAPRPAAQSCEPQMCLRDQRRS